MYTNELQLDNNDYGMVPIDTTKENMYLLDEPTPDFSFLFDDIGEGVPFEYAKPLNSVPPVEPVNSEHKNRGEKHYYSNWLSLDLCS
ncbi:unnamed protein product [Prunus armeniaca]